MGAAENRQKSAAMAAHMKERGIRRTTGSCPWGCGHQITIGGPALLTHLNTCQGKRSKRAKRMTKAVRR